MLYRCNYHENQNNGFKRQLAFSGKTLFEHGTLPIIPKLSVDETIAIQTHLDLSRRDIRFLKAILEDKVDVPNTNDILEYKKRLRPALIECRDGREIMVQCRFDVIVLTLKRLIDVAKSQGKHIP